MDVFEAIYQRRAVKHYDPQHVMTDEETGFRRVEAERVVVCAASVIVLDGERPPGFRPPPCRRASNAHL